MVIQVGVELCLFFSTRSRTDGSSSSCELIILRNKSHSEIIRVCMGIYAAALRNKKIQSNSHTPSLNTRGSKTIYWCQVTGGSRRGTVCKGGRVDKLVFNRHVYLRSPDGVGFTGKIEFVVNWNETIVYLLELWVGFVAARSFWAWSFRFSDRAFGNGVCSFKLLSCFLLHVVNLEVDNSLKWVLFNIVSGQITSDVLRKEGEVLLSRIWLYFYIPKAVVNIPLLTPIISPWFLFRRTIISQLELGPLVVRGLSREQPVNCFPFRASIERQRKANRIENAKRTKRA